MIEYDKYDFSKEKDRFAFLDEAKLLEVRANEHRDSLLFSFSLTMVGIMVTILGAMVSWGWIELSLSSLATAAGLYETLRHYKEFLRRKDGARDALYWYYGEIGKPKRAEEFRRDQQQD